MMITWWFYLLPFFSAVLGWLCARLIVSIYISAIIRKKKEITTAIGNYAEQQFSLDDVEKQLTNPDNIQNILPFAEGHIDNFLRVKLPAAMPMLAMFISDKLVAEMKGIFMNELKDLIPALIKQYIANIKKDISIGNIISTKLNVISTDTIKPFLRKQLQVTEYACAITGFVCGCLYILLTWLA